MEMVKQATVACELCHSVKKKCSGGPPPCERCKKMGQHCYIPTVRKKNQRLIDLEAKLRELEISARELPPASAVLRLNLLQSNKKIEMNNLVTQQFYRNLLDTYLSVHHKVFPFIDPARLERELENDSSNSFLLNTVYCLTSRYNQNNLRYKNRDRSQLPLQKDGFYLRSLERLGLLSGDTTLEMIQGLLILNLLECGCIIFDKASLHLAMAISKAQAMGLHSINASKSLETSNRLKIEMRATWAICLYFDCATSIYTNKTYTTPLVYDGLEDENLIDLPPLIHSLAENSSSEHSELQTDSSEDNHLSSLVGYKTKDMIMMEGTYLHALIAKYKSRAMALRRRAFRGEIPLEELGSATTRMYFQTMDRIPSHLTIDYLRHTSCERDPLVIAYFYLRLSIAADRLASILAEASHRGLSAEDTLIRIREVSNIFRLLRPSQDGQWEPFELVNWIPGLVFFLCTKLILVFPRFVSDPEKLGPVQAQYRRLTKMFERCTYHWPLVKDVIPNIVNVSMKFIT